MGQPGNRTPRQRTAAAATAADRQMEASYLDQDMREHELTKHISLARGRSVAVVNSAIER